MIRKGSWRIVGLATLVLVAVAALGAGAGQSARDRSLAGTIISGTTDTVTNLDPAGSYDFGTFAIDVLVYEQLMGFPNGPKLRPVLATGCRANRSLKIWTCTLRRGVKFHDGSTFDSADVKWTFDRVKKINDPSGISSLLGNLQRVTTGGPYSVSFHLKSPQSTWPFILSSGAGFIVPKDTYPGTRLRPNSAQQIGTGRYKLTRYTQGQQAVLEPNDDYWGAKPRNDGLIVRYYSRSSTMKIALQRGEIDMTFRAFTPTELRSLQSARGIRVHAGSGSEIRYFVMNVTRPPTNNIAVRRALAYLFPRQAIAARAHRGTVEPLYSLPPKGLPGHIDAFATVYGRSPSVAKARAVLRRAGVTTPVALDVWYTPTHYGDASADEYAEIKRALDASGLFRITLKSTEWAQYSDVLGRQYNAFQLGWYPDYADPENYLVPFYRSDTFTANGYKNPRMEALIKKELAARTPAARYAVIRQAQQLAARDVPIIPYWQGKMISAARSNVRGIPSTLDASFIMRYWLVSK